MIKLDDFKILVLLLVIGGSVLYIDSHININSPFQSFSNNISSHNSSLGAAATGFTVAYPEAPRQTVDTAMPQTTRTVRVHASDCNDPSTGLQARLDQAQGGDEIVIAAGQECLGQYVFPARSENDTGWIVVRTAASDNQLLRDKRVTPNDTSKLATIKTNSLNLWRIDTFGDNPPNHKGVGSLWYPWRIDDPVWGVGANPLGLWRYWGNEGWKAEPYTEGVAVPRTCTPGQWFRKTDIPQERIAQHIYRCVTPNMFVKIDTNKNSAPVTFEDGAHHYRIVGLEITQIPEPNPPHPLLSQEAVPRQNGSVLESLVNIGDSAHHIVIDRSYIHGAGYPARVLWGIRNNGEHIGIIDSYISDINVWTGGTFDQNTISVAIDLGLHSEGPVKIQNNYIEAVGINIFVSAGNTSDVELLGNHITKPSKFMSGSADSDGNLYNNRHLLEFKGGKRWLIEGNIFENNWSVVNQGAVLSVQYPNKADAITDINFRNNIVKKAPYFTIILGNKDIGPTNRINIENNLIYNIDGNTWQASHASIGPTGRSGMFLDIRGSVQDVHIHNNTVHNRQGAWPYLIETRPDSGTGFVVENNIFDVRLTHPILNKAGSWIYGTEALGSAFRNYSFTNNAIINHVAVNTSVYPEGNMWFGSDSAIGLINVNTDNLQLSQNSVLKGKNIGVDRSTLDAVTRGVASGIFNQSVTTSSQTPVPPRVVIPIPPTPPAPPLPADEPANEDESSSPNDVTSASNTSSSSGGGSSSRRDDSVSSSSGGGGGGGGSSVQRVSNQSQTSPSTPVSTSSVSPSVTISRNLSVGSRGSDVVQLQQFLISNNFLEAGNDTGFFGPLTERAVQRFQSAEQIVSSGSPATTGYGVVGPLTRRRLAQIPVTGINTNLPNSLNIVNTGTLTEEQQLLVKRLNQQILLLQIQIIKLLRIR